MCLCGLSYPACKEYASYCSFSCGLSDCTAFFFFAHYNRQGFWKKVIEHKMCVLIIRTTVSEKFLILRIIQRNIIKNMQTSSCKVAVILVRF